MENYFHNYEFIIDDMATNEAISAYQNVEVCYKKIEKEKILYSINGGGGYTLYLEDRFFNFEIDIETKRISSFDAELTFCDIESANLLLPVNFKNVVLKLKTEDNLLQGCGGYVEFDTKPIYYDKKQKILQIGKIETAKLFYKFLNNVYTQITNNKITGLLITEIEL